ncbi:MAG TPA: ABC transporter ATP-binding protein [Candidatus Saccharimonadales bacterium]|jgi:ATP-binding cassette subfamily B protein|nr:ABC transporter ATP-binding protein [Candidatus Saccharimonadales bacterium]
MKRTQPKPTIKTVRFFWDTAWRHPGHVLGLLIGGPLTVFIYSFLPPLIMASVLNRLSKGDYQAGHIWASFGPSLVAYAVLMMFGGIFAWRVVDILDWHLEGKVERDLARRVFNHLLQQSASFHSNRFGGSLVSQTSKLLGAYIRVADTTVFQLLPLLTSIVCATAILAPRAPEFAAILFGFCVFFIACSVLVTRKVRTLSVKQANAESAQTGYLADAITNVMAIKSFAGTPFEKRQFDSATDKTRNYLNQLMVASQKQQAFFGTLTNIISALSLTMAVVGVMTYHANLGTVFLILTYTSIITQQLWMFGTGTLKNYNRALGDAQDMVEILSIEPEVKDPQSPEKSRIKQGAIELRNVEFTHPESRQDDSLFNNLSLNIKAGEKIGVVGHSGSGKTTLTKLLLRYNDIDSGEILIDGQNIARITQDDLRSSVAYVPQEPLLFHRSIRENIAYGKPDATEAEIQAAATKAFADEFIATLPKGYDTLVGERGVKLSGGQRQRIVIARAIIKDAPILVLDEATSALDSESEKLIQAALWKLMENRTAIVIAHRLSTIQRMDRIVVLDHGAIAEEGTHQSLLRSKGTYARLWAHQSGGFLED